MRGRRGGGGGLSGAAGSHLKYSTATSTSFGLSPAFEEEQGYDEKSEDYLTVCSNPFDESPGPPSWGVTNSGEDPSALSS